MNPTTVLTIVTAVAMLIAVSLPVVLMVITARDGRKNAKDLKQYFAEHPDSPLLDPNYPLLSQDEAIELLLGRPLSRWEKAIGM